MTFKDSFITLILSYCPKIYSPKIKMASTRTNLFIPWPITHLCCQTNPQAAPSANWFIVVLPLNPAPNLLDGSKPEQFIYPPLICMHCTKDWLNSEFSLKRFSIPPGGKRTRNWKKLSSSVSFLSTANWQPGLNEVHDGEEVMRTQVLGRE